MDFLKAYDVVDDVYQISQKSGVFEKEYLSIRDKECRLYEDQIVKKLPHTSPHFSQEKEWKKRVHSAGLFMSYLENRSDINILDIGCGNGWFTHLMHGHSHAYVLGIDINQVELAQAARLFSLPKCQFAYADPLLAKLPSDFFDLIVFNSSIQYFSELDELIKKLSISLTSKGEIHFLDSPIYKSPAEAKEAKGRSEQYFLSQESRNMSNFYFHHTIQDFESYNFTALYDAEKFTNKLIRKVGIHRSPFNWIKIKKLQLR